MLSVAKRVKSSMLVANAWHARSDAASSLVVGVGIVGNLAGYPILDPIAAAIVGFMVAKMGWEFGWDALHDLMDRAIDDEEVAAIRQTLAETVRRAGRARHSHAQDGRHDRGRRAHRGRCLDQRGSGATTSPCRREAV
jgi:divalent metal cation (Fe/Co/Zn/Cd) transporter